MKQSYSVLIGCGVSLLLSGCLTETQRPFEVPKLVLFNGMYENAQDNSFLVFEAGEVEYKSSAGDVKRTYYVDGDLITIEVARASSKAPSDLVMRIHQEGQLLTCNRCPIMSMSNVWTRIESFESK